MTDFVPKIVKSGKRYGQKTTKYGLCIMAYQKSSGKNNNSAKRRKEGKVYSNSKLDRVSRKVSFFMQSKGVKANLRSA